MNSASAAALLISAPASGQGKTTLTAALARHAVRCQRRVRVFKVGADFIDAGILSRASGQPVWQLDAWMGGLAHCRQLLHEAAIDHDLLLIEGAMGLHDGQPSTADLAAALDVPVAAVIDANAMAQTFGALALGLRSYRRSPASPRLLGVFANRVAGPAHATMLADSLRELDPPLAFLGALPADAALTLPDRHLGLVQAEEVADLDARLDRATAALTRGVIGSGEAGETLAASPLELLRFESWPRTAFPAQTPQQPPPALLRGLHLAVARDAACSFIYPANLALVTAMGASLSYFSPLEEAPPQADAIYLPGGYPELHAGRLAANQALHAALRAHVVAGRALLAECGGMMLLFERLVDLQGREHCMAGLLPGATRMQPRLQSLAAQAVHFPSGELRGHSFHHSSLHTTLSPALRAHSARGTPGEAVFQQRALTATYIHFYWPSQPQATAQLLLPESRRNP